MGELIYSWNERYVKSDENLIWRYRWCLPDMDDKCPWLHSVVYKRYELIEELLIDRDCQEFGKQSRRVVL
jgi:hypothetical protein